MRQRHISAIAPAVLALLVPGLTEGDTVSPEAFWGVICGVGARTATRPVPRAALPPVHCGALPAGFHEIPSVGTGGDVTVDLGIGFDPDTDRLCYAATSVPEAPVIRVGVGHHLNLALSNTLSDTATHNTENCAIQEYGGEGECTPSPQFTAAPGPDGKFYPLQANQAHSADGTSNLHVHGLFVSPQPCSDEVLKSTIYPVNWGGPVAMTAGCQTTPGTLTYSYALPTNHPAGLYWYHSHRHGESEQETQMGLAGAIVVEDAGDAWRRSIGVGDEVLVVDDQARRGCLDGISCDIGHHPLRQPNREAARAKARREIQPAVAAAPVLDPRIDQANQAGECAGGATGNGEAGGTQLWTLTLNGAQVAENQDGTLPPDNEVMSKTMRPGQRQIFRMVNASADSFVAPRLVLVKNGQQTVLPLEVFARDGVGLADAQGNRHFHNYDVTKTAFVVPPAGRVEFVVHAPPSGAKLYLDSAQVLPGCGGNAYPARRLLLIKPAGTAVAAGPADDSDLLLHTPSLQPYLSTLAATATVHRTIVLAEYGRDFTYGVTKWLSGPPTAADYNGGQTDFYIPVVASDDGEVVPSKTALVPFAMGALPAQVVVHLHGKESVTEEWLVENSTLEIHAFHMHQIHFRDISSASPIPDSQPMLDTVTVPAAPLVGDISSGYPGAPGWVRLRMTFTKADIGEFVFHCHILEHEDNGMMGKILVVAN